MSRAVSLLTLTAGSLVMLSLAGCSAGPFSSGAGSRKVDQATRDACRDRTSQAFDKQNRGEIFAPNSSMNAPFSANYQSGVSSHGLAEQFSYGKMQTECEQTHGAVGGAATAKEQ